MSIDRREFIGRGVIIAAGLVVDSIVPGYLNSSDSNPEVETITARVRRGDRDPRTLLLEPRNNPTVEKINSLWLKQYVDQNHPTPDVVMFALKEYGPAAVASEQLRIRALEFERVQERTGEMNRVVDLWRGLEPRLAEIEAQFGKRSEEYKNEFLKGLNEYGYSGVLATKTGIDVGKVYEFEIWDNRLHEWRGHKGKPIRYLVLDMMTERTFYENRGDEFSGAEMYENGEKVIFGYGGDISIGFVSNDMGIETAGQVLYVRGKESSATDILLAWPEYERQPLLMSPNYVQLGERVRETMRSDNFRGVLKGQIGEVLDKFEMDVSGIPRDTSMDRGKHLAWTWSQLGIDLVWEPVSTADYVAWIETTKNPDQVGIPMGIFMQSELINRWARNGVLKESRFTTNKLPGISDVKNGFWSVVDMPDHYGDEQLVTMGMCFSDDDGSHFVWFDDRNKTVMEETFRTDGEFQAFFSNTDGTKSLTRVLKLFS